MKTVVVGAGGGGIASALLASLRGEKVTLLEAHENLGGCASWFDRRDFSFDVGATTLSGLGAGEPLWEFFRKLDAFPAVHQIDPGISFHLSTGKIVHYYADREKWMRELESKFPDLNHRPFWELVFGLNQQAWGLLNNLSSFPFRSVWQLRQLLKVPRHFHLFPYLLVNTEIMLKRYQLHSPEYLEMLNGILLISAQTEAPHVPFLVGAMALAYPATTFAPRGGMKGFMSFLEKQCRDRGIDVRTNARVDLIHERQVRQGSSLEEADRIILNLTRWDMPKIFTSEERYQLERELSEPKEAWGAFTVYFGVQTQEKNLYQQVHLNHPLIKNYFISFSDPSDRTRAPLGWQAVTISTHVDASEWFGISKDEYRRRKDLLQNLILDDFKRRFNVQQFKYLTSGTPKTFQRYTGRKSGFVGGLPFLYGMNPWKLLDHRTPLEYVYRVGDTTFPGQGIVGVVAGALALDQELKKAP
jgi:C-3',4' desaturase CrtD